MSSMDAVHEKMLAFQKEIKQFHELLEQTSKEMELRHADVDGLWRDAARRDYDQRWLPLHKKLQEYRKLRVPKYERFLAEKLQALHKYLRGNS